ncbi:MAG TPA: hypothetical protein VN703_02595 [Candidatus Sulfopaludibacter sp.]|nr:hypothetical protein [Candidatus Sulfopaludibacter sp.]
MSGRLTSSVEIYKLIAIAVIMITLAFVFYKGWIALPMPVHNIACSIFASYSITSLGIRLVKAITGI